MSAMLKPSYMTVAGFLEWENQQDTRNELLDGEIVAMTGGTFAHARLTARLVTKLSNHLENTPCVALASDLKVQAAENIFYPDVIVSCAEQENQDLLCKEPRLIIEVLSNSTSRRDRFQKRLAYQQIASLEEYVLIAQEVKHVEIYRRADDWRVSVYTEGLIELRSVELTLALDDLYAGII